MIIKQMPLMRSLMFVPGHNRRLLESASKSEADVILTDIEDSVQPESNKQSARDMIKEFVAAGKFANHLVFPRVNDRESGHLLQDVYQLTVPGIAGFMYPKSRLGEDIYFFDKLLATIEYEKKIPLGTFKIIALIETTAAVLNAQDLCRASDRVVALAYGCEDFLTDLEGIHDEDSRSLFVPRAMIAMAARANGVVPIDTVHVKVHDLPDLERNLKIAKNLGFEGMLVLNPKEIELAHKYFSPAKNDVEAAKDMLRLAEESHSEGKGVSFKDGKFIGPPMIITANKTLLKDEMIKQKKRQ